MANTIQEKEHLEGLTWLMQKQSDFTKVRQYGNSSCTVASEICTAIAIIALFIELNLDSLAIALMPQTSTNSRILGTVLDGTP